jgi:hypothetical protein
MGVLILQGQARYRLAPVLPEPASAPLRLDETARRMVELTASEVEASTFNLWNETHMLSPVDRHLLLLLDGTRGRDALVEALLAVDRENPIPVERDGRPVSGEVERREALSELVEELPQRLTEMKLLRVN